MTSSIFIVVGMTCHSCAMTVTDEVRQVLGVQHVAVELATAASPSPRTPPLTRG